MNFRNLTYDIHRAIGMDRLFRPERIAKILEHYDADIILLQEVDVGVPSSQKLNLARERTAKGACPYVGGTPLWLPIFLVPTLQRGNAYRLCAVPTLECGNEVLSWFVICPKKYT